MQTAVELLIYELKQRGFTIQYHLEDKCLSLEKQQIEDAYIDGSNIYRNTESVKPDAENYYKFKFHKP